MRDKIIIADDIEMNRDILEEILEDKGDILKAGDGQQALMLLKENKSDVKLLLLDLVMPVFDGFDVLEMMNMDEVLKKVPVIVISSESAAQIEEKCLNFGVVDFIQKPFSNGIVRKRVENVINLHAYQNRLEDKVKSQNDTLRAQFEVLQKQAERLKDSNKKIIDILGTVVEGRNLESGIHIKRVKGYTAILATEVMNLYSEYGLNLEMVDRITTASALHDIGKIAIPDSILLKPGKLTDDEFEMMKSHSAKGSEILENITGVWDEEYGQVGYEICRYHHERYDGRGYPDGLVGDEIPISAQIVSIADVYDALVNERIYKSAYSKEDAFRMIIKGECGMFSPKLLEAFRNCREKFESFSDNSEM